MRAAAIIAEGLSKRLTISGGPRSWSLRGRLDDALARWRGSGGRQDETIWALLDVSFQIAEGEVVGVVGRNGAGKSTLLKVLSRIIEPTRGRAVVRGRVGSLLEVGTGFHRDLTGRENVFLSGAILGMRRREITIKFDDIIAFAEVERFVDTPVKYYSSGMYLRLAFAVAAHLEPEVLLIDEVLAVGDAAFQKKCLGKMGEVASRGRTVLFVSHNLAAVRKLCPSSILLERGRLAAYGPSRDVLRTYVKSSYEEPEGLDRTRRLHRSEEAEITGGWLEQDGYRTSTVSSGLQTSVCMEIRVRRRVRLSVEVVVRDAVGVPIFFCPGGLARGQELDLEPGDYRIIGQGSPLAIAEGRYSVDLMLAETDAGFLDYLESALVFDVSPTAIGPRNWAFRQDRGQGSLYWPVDFSCHAADRPDTDDGSLDTGL